MDSKSQLQNKGTFKLSDEILGDDWNVDKWIEEIENNQNSIQKE